MCVSIHPSIQPSKQPHSQPSSQSKHTHTHTSASPPPTQPAKPGRQVVPIHPPFHYRSIRSMGQKPTALDGRINPWDERDGTEVARQTDTRLGELVTQAGRQAYRQADRHSWMVLLIARSAREVGISPRPRHHDQRAMC
mmetsp:Transcript_27527/g.79188  ORF Transcript_27527/g.79188 Transcript_27527/m.79188 type:complete len:139 (-) Transcript_27527:1539-1955(-)